MKNISQVILLSTSCLIWYGADNVCASVNVFSGIPKSGTHNTLHTTPYLAYPHLPHLRGERSVRGGMSRTERSAMLTSCLPQTLSNSLPEVGEARRGVTSEASISLSSNIEKMSLTGLIPPRELLTRLKSGEFLLPLPQGEDNKLNVFKTASVCFITDTGACSGEKFSNDETPGNGSGNPGGIPDYDTPQEQCQAAGYGVTSCPAGSHGDNPCPADSSYYQKCVCDANMTQTCTKPYYGVGPSCDGKYASCKRDDDKACKEDGYGQTAQCSSVQTPNKKCSYNSGYYDKCVCRSDLVTCTYPQSGVGEACGGKYASCQCPGSYKSCECGGAAGATSCTVNGVTTYSSCKSCCENRGTLTSCPTGYRCEYEACTNKYYKVDGCQSGYDWNATTQNCTSQCAASYKYDCTGSNQTKPSSESCDGKYTSCNCRIGYFWTINKCCKNSYKYDCNGANERGYGASCTVYFEICGCRGEYIWNKNDGKCRPIKTCTNDGRNCCIGQILNSDGTCSDNKISGKTPIGIVVYIGEDNKGQALALTEYGKAYWGGYGVSFEFSRNTIEGEIDFDSCGNTQKIIAQGVAQGDDTAFPAVRASANYAPNTAPETKGKWCLPSSGVGRMIVIYIDRINQGMSAAGGELLSKTTDFDNQYWTSTPAGSSNAIHWRYRSDLLNPDYFGNSDRRASFRIRPVIEF